MSNITAGVRTDFENILKEFSKTDSVRYECFLEVWRAMKVPQIFCGRPIQRELQQFTEDCLRIAVSLWMPPKPPNDLLQRVGALYLLYGLYNTQLLKIKAKIRVTAAEWQEVLAFQQEIEAQQHYDACYILRWLKANNAFHFTATPAPLYPCMPGHNDELDEEEKDLQDEQNKGNSVVSMLIQSNIIDELSSVHDQYYTMKCALNNGQHPHTSLNIIHPNIVQTITKTVAAHEEWRKIGRRGKRKRRDSGMTSESEPDSEGDHIPVTRNQGNIRTSIRDKAYSQTAVSSKSRRHRLTDGSTSASISDGSPEKQTTKRGRKTKAISRSSDSDKAGKKSKTAAEKSEEEAALSNPTPEDGCDEGEASGISRSAMRTILLDMPLLEKDEKKGKKSRISKATKKTSKTEGGHHNKKTNDTDLEKNVQRKDEQSNASLAPPVSKKQKKSEGASKKNLVEKSKFLAKKNGNPTKVEKTYKRKSKKVNADT